MSQEFTLEHLLHAIASERDSYLAAGMDDYLTKPFEPQQLADVLDRWTSAGEPVREAASPAVAAGTLIDERRLGELSGIMTAERFAALIEAWVASAEQLTETLAGAARAGNDALLAGEAHKLTGSAANFGAQALAALARRIESEVRAGDAASARACAAEIEMLYRETVVAMRAHGGRPGAVAASLAAG